MLNIAHTQKDEKIRGQVKGIVALPRGMKLEPPAETISFVLNKDTVNNIDERIPDWLKDMIRKSVTYKELTEPQLPEDVFTPEDQEFHEIDF